MGASAPQFGETALNNAKIWKSRGKDPSGKPLSQERMAEYTECVQLLENLERLPRLLLDDPELMKLLAEKKAEGDASGGESEG